MCKFSDLLACVGASGLAVSVRLLTFRLLFKLHQSPSSASC